MYTWTSTAKFLWAAQTKKGTSYKLLELHASSWNCMKAHGTACKHMELHTSSCNCMQAHVTECKLMWLHASSCDYMQDILKSTLNVSCTFLLRNLCFFVLSFDHVQEGKRVTIGCSMKSILSLTSLQQIYSKIISKIEWEN